MTATKNVKTLDTGARTGHWRAAVPVELLSGQRQAPIGSP